MKITIQGQDYTSALDGEHPLTINRKLNVPSVCQLWLSLPNTLPQPSRNQSIKIIGDENTIYFTGYIAVSPLPEYAGMALEGPRYRIAVEAISDEILLDQLLMPTSSVATNSTAGALLTSLVTHTGSAALTAPSTSLSVPVNNIVSEPGASWSERAAQVASQSRAAYRAQNGALALNSVGSILHPLNETDGSLNLAALSFTATVERALANDITVCGDREPAAYITEYFLGDGVTTQFYLADDPYFLAAAKSNLLHDLFNGPAIDQTVWSNTGLAGYLSLGAAGLVMNGGTGTDGQIALTFIDPVEMGGTLLLEAAGLTLAPGSTGIVAGFYNGPATQSGCIAGFQATAQQGTGDVTIQPLIQGNIAGTSYAINPANQYTLRARVHSPESERALSIYRSCGDNGAITTGGQINACAGKLQLEIQEFVNGVAGMPVTLYDGAVTTLPATCTLVAASSINLIGSLRSLTLTSLGSAWAVSTPPTGGPYTRRIGSTAQSAECHIDRTGKLVFYTGSTPAIGEQVAVSYRTIGRAVGRSVNQASQSALAQAGSPAVSAWIGSVTSPAARSSADCRNAASAIEQASTGVSALCSGAYAATRAGFSADVWPGDALQLNAPSTNLNAQVVVRTVKLTYTASVPDLVHYAIQFANDWADDLAIKTSKTVPADAWLPAPIAPVYLANLTGLTVTSLNGSTVTINTGANPPAAGGFEIRRRDFSFMPGEDPGLVARASLPNITFSRETANDRFYIRMFDASTPPNYSEFSAALLINLPLGS